MAVESATYISQLNSSYPPGTDPRSQGDDHLRLIKAALQATFPSLNGVWTGIAHTFTATQTIKSTDAGASAGPDFVLHRDSASPAASDYLGQLLWKGEDTASNADTFAAVRAQILDATSTSEDGQLEFAVVTAGSLAYELALTGAALFPLADQGLHLGSASLRFDAAFLTSIELGHASDTTITRTSAGNLAVEGNTIYRAGGTDVAIADGGTGASTIAAAFANLANLDLNTTLPPNSLDRALIFIGGDNVWNRMSLGDWLERAFRQKFGTTKGSLIWYNGSNWVALNPP